MKKNLSKFMVMLALAALICLPGMASADYVQNWVGEWLVWDPEYSTNLG